MGTGASKRAFAAQPAQATTPIPATMADKEFNDTVDLKGGSHLPKGPVQSKIRESGDIAGNPDGRTEKESKKFNGKDSESVPPIPVEGDPESMKQTDINTVHENSTSISSELDNMNGSNASFPKTSDTDDSDSDDSDDHGKDDNAQSRERCLKLAGRLKQLIARIKEVFSEQDYKENMEFYFKLVEMNSNYLAIGNAKPAVSQPIWKDVSNELITQGVDEILYAVVMDSLPQTGSSESEITNLERKILSEVVSGLFNFTDDSVPIAIKVCEKDGLLEILAEAALYHAVFMSTTKSSEVRSLLNSVLGLIYNCSLQYDNRKRLRDVGFSWILRRIMAGKDRPMDETFTATIALAGILDEEESKSLQSEKGCLSMLAHWLGKAVQKPERRFSGWSAKELAAACSRLAGNDVNKKFLAKWGMLDSLCKLCEVGDTDEQKEGLGALWSLAFNDDNKDQMLEREDLIQTVAGLRECPDKGVKTLAVNTLWTLRDKLKSSSNRNFQTLGEDLSTSISQSPHLSSEETVTSGKHIMISYSWDNKVIVFKVHEELERNGYRVWIDRNEMKGSIIDSIADGVENADAMLMCISQKYKISKYCRAEAEYAFTRDIGIIPLLMESDFKADGWLGLIKGAKKHFDFGQSDFFEVTFPTLVKELGHNGKGHSVKAKIIPLDEPDTFVQSTPDAFSGQGLVTNGHGTVAVMSTNHVTNWSPEDVRKWLQDNGCFGNCFQKMTGSELLFLKNLKKEAPEYFYSVLETKLKLKDIKGLTKLVQALESL